MLDELSQTLQRIEEHRLNMTQIRVYARNLFASWVGYAANLLVVFFLSPFIVQSLGDVQYGVWSLMVSLTGYLGLIEAGTQAGLGRFINFHLGRKEFEKVSGIASTGMAIFLAMGAILAVVACCLALLLPSIFAKIPGELMGEARILCLLVALNLWLSLLAAPSRLIIQSKERFELTNGIDLLVVLGRAAGTIAVLMSGGGLTELAYVQISSSLIGLLAAHVVARRIMPELSISARQVSFAQFRELFGFSSWAFLAMIGYRLMSSTDAVVIAILLGPEWVTLYAIGDTLVQRATDLGNRGIHVFAPKMIQDCAKEDFQSLRMHYRQSVLVAMGVGILVAIGMICFSREFIELWMGPRFGESYIVVAILASSWLLSITFAAALPIFSGLNRVRLSAVLILMQSVANIALSVSLVAFLDLGLAGVAWGTFYPRIGVCLLGTAIIMRLISMPIAAGSRDLARWALLSTVFYFLCELINQLPFAGGWSSFFTKVACSVTGYGILAWFLLLSKSQRAFVIRAFSTRWASRFANPKAMTESS